MTKSTKSSIIRTIGKVLKHFVGGVLVLLVLLLLLIHIPFIQDIITDKATRFLSEKTGGELTIERLRFSVFGDVLVEGLEAIDPNEKAVLSLGHLSLETNIRKLLSGKIVLNELDVSDLDGELIINDRVLNIEYIIDAFASDAPRDTSKGDSQIHLFSNDIDLDQIHFTLINNGDSLIVNADSIAVSSVDYKISDGRIRVDSIFVADSGVRMLMQVRAKPPAPPVDEDVNKKPVFPDFDFGSGMDIKVGSVEMQGGAYSLHYSADTLTEQFDYRHLDVSAIVLNGNDLVMTRDEMSAAINQLTAMVGTHKVPDFRAGIYGGRQEARIDSLSAGFDHSYLVSNFKATYPEWTDIPQQIDQIIVDASLDGTVLPEDLGYFLSDSMMQWIADWDMTDVDLSLNHQQRRTKIQRVSLKTDSSMVEVKGTLVDALNSRSDLTWRDIRLTSTIGPEFKSTFNAFVDSVDLPEHLSLQYQSTGKIAEFKVDGGVMSSWGDLQSNGTIGWKNDILVLDLSNTGENVALNEITREDRLDSCDLNIHVIGEVGQDMNLAFDGEILSIGLLNQAISDIALEGTLTDDSVSAHVKILDPRFGLNADAQLAYSDLISISGIMELDSFHYGLLLGGDTSSLLSGQYELSFFMDSNIISGDLRADTVLIADSETSYLLDSLIVHLYSSFDSSNVLVNSDDVTGYVISNFAFEDIMVVLDSLIASDLTIIDNIPAGYEDKAFDFSFKMQQPAPFALLDIDVEEFSGIVLQGSLDDETHDLIVRLEAGQFKGMGLTLDTIDAEFSASQERMRSFVSIEDITYNGSTPGDFDWALVSENEGATSGFLLATDSNSLIGIRGKIQREANTLRIYPDSLVLLDAEFVPEYNGPILVGPDTFYIDQFSIKDETMSLVANGNKDNFEVDAKNVDLTALNYFINSDSALIKHGILNGEILYSSSTERFDCQLTADSLVLYKSEPMHMEATAYTTESSVPLELNISSQSNEVIAKGEYNWESNNVEGNLNLDIDDLGSFKFLLGDALAKMEGEIEGSAEFSGPPDAVTYDGSILLQNVDVVTAKPRSILRIEDETISLNNSGISMSDFVILDEWGNPMVVNGSLRTNDYTEFDYDLSVVTDNFFLINNPRNGEYALEGILAIGSDIRVTGNRFDTDLQADIVIKDTTNLHLNLPEREVELMTSEGIVEFIDPATFNDSVDFVERMSFYDSLVANLPDFNLNSNVTLEKNALFTVVVDPNSGDYVQAAGAANIEFNFDRTGNVRLNGSYEITEGFYQLSFYDLVRKRFDITPGSSVQWSGIPETGEIDIVAQHTVKTSSLGLIGHEIGENEKSQYRRALPYIVSINIQGTMDEPVVSFGLDLSREDRANFPALDNKLNRLEQPEFESELNRQVFGLLVLGGFIPQSNNGDFDEMAVATTALANSVNSLLAAQLNKLTNQIEGIEINIGLQSYTDYYQGNSQTRTAMDFRVTKRMLDDRLSFEVGGEVDLNVDQSGARTGSNNFRGDIAVVYDLTESGNRKLKAFNNETYDIIYHEVRNTGIALIFIREFDKGERRAKRRKEQE